MMRFEKRDFGQSLSLTLVLLFLLFRNVIAQGEPEVIRETTVPLVLFHWTSPRDLQRMVDNNPNGAPMGLISQWSVLARQHPLLARRNGVFAWTNPVLGGAWDSGIYGLSPEPPRLVAYAIREGSRVAEIRTLYKSNPTDPLPELRDFDLILNRVVSETTGQILFQEWVILNPNAVSEYTADPKALKPSVRAEWDRIESAHVYNRDELFYLPEKEQNPILWKFLSYSYLMTDSAGIPSQLLGPKGAFPFQAPPQEASPISTNRLMAWSPSDSLELVSKINETQRENCISVLGKLGLEVPALQ